MKSKTKNKTVRNKTSRLEITDSVDVVYGQCPKNSASNTVALLAIVSADATLTADAVEIKSLDFSYDVAGLHLCNEGEQSKIYNISNRISSIMAFEEPISIELLEYFAQCMNTLAESLREKHEDASKIL